MVGGRKVDRCGGVRDGRAQLGPGASHHDLGCWNICLSNVACSVDAVFETPPSDEPPGAHFASAIPATDSSVIETLVSEVCGPCFAGFRFECLWLRPIVVLLVPFLLLFR